MPCDRTLRPNQTIQQRAEEIRETVSRLQKGLANGSIKAIVGPQGGVAFEGLTDADRNGVTDNCAYRRILATGSATSKLALMKAEQLAGRKIDQKAVAQGLHAHNGVWHFHKG